MGILDEGLGRRRIQGGSRLTESDGHDDGEGVTLVVQVMILRLKSLTCQRRSRSQTMRNAYIGLAKQIVHQAGAFSHLHLRVASARLRTKDVADRSTKNLPGRPYVNGIL